MVLSRYAFSTEKSRRTRSRPVPASCGMQTSTLQGKLPARPSASLQLIRHFAVGAHHVGHAVGQDQLRAGWTLRQSEPYGAHLIDPDYDQIFVVPRDVMEHLIRHDIIELEREQ